MADFTYIHQHPWITVGAIAGGGFILFLILHKRSASASTEAQPVYTGTTGGGVDPNIAANLAAQQMQAQASISGLTIQGQTQIELARIGAGVQTQTVVATQDVTNRQTDAQLQLGLGSLGAQVAIEQIGASVQMRSIDAIVQAFTGNHPIYNPTPTTTTPVANNTNNPISTSNPPQIMQPDYLTPTTSIGAPDPWGFRNGGTGGSGIVPGGTQLLPYPTYVQSDPAQYPGMAAGATCSPLDAYCVAQNEAISNQYHVDVANAQTVNNLTQLVSNYQQSAISGRLTPSQQTEMSYYESQLQAAGGTVPSYTVRAPAQVVPAQVNTY